MNILDLVLLGLLLLFGLRGYFKGLFRETLSLAGLIVGFIVAVRYNQTLAMLIQEYWEVSPLVLKGVSFVTIFFLVFFLFNLVGWFLHRSENVLFLKALNRTGGIAIGILKGAALMALAVFFLAPASWIPAPVKEKLVTSVLVPPLSRFAEGIIRIGKERIFTTQDEPAQPTGKSRIL